MVNSLLSNQQNATDANSPAGKDALEDISGTSDEIKADDAVETSCEVSKNGPYNQQVALPVLDDTASGLTKGDPSCQILAMSTLKATTENYQGSQPVTEDTIHDAVNEPLIENSQPRQAVTTTMVDAIGGNSSLSDYQHQNQAVEEDDNNSPSATRNLSFTEEYLVKSIDWVDPKTGTNQTVRIITQNENGPCPLISICNVLFIRGDIHIRPFERDTVTFTYLMECLGDYLLNHAPTDVKTPTESPPSPRMIQQQQQQEIGVSADTRQSTMEYALTYRHNLDAALTILPRLRKGLDVNVQFSSIHDFEPTAELALFDLFNVDLVHGWIVDPQDEETYRVVNQCKSYNGIVECIVRGNETNVETGSLPHDHNDDDGNGSKFEKENNIHDGLVASAFLQDTATQLTYYGIELLTDTLPKNKLCVLFRNNHFSTLYKHPSSDCLYTLVTDSGLVSEPNIVWESLSDVDQGASEFVNSQFIPSSSSSSSQKQTDRETADLDYAIALSLQQHQQEIMRTSRESTSRNIPRIANHTTISGGSNDCNLGDRSQQASGTMPRPPNRSKKSCIIS